MTKERERIKKLARRLDKCHRASSWVEKTHKDKIIGGGEEMCSQFFLSVYEVIIFLVAVTTSIKWDQIKRSPRKLLSIFYSRGTTRARESFFKNKPAQ